MIESDFALAGRLEQGVVKSGKEVVSLPTHTARLQARARGKYLLWKCIINDWTRLAQVTLLG